MTRDRIIAPISSDDGPSAPVRHESEYYRTRLALVKIITNPLTVFHSGRFFWFVHGEISSADNKNKTINSSWIKRTPESNGKLIQLRALFQTLYCSLVLISFTPTIIMLPLELLLKLNI